MFFAHNPSFGVAIFLYIQTAFSTVGHQKLLMFMVDLGIRGLPNEVQPTKSNNIDVHK